MESHENRTPSPSKDTIPTNPPPGEALPFRGKKKEDSANNPLKLPLEVILVIVDHLPADAILALQLSRLSFTTCSNIRAILELKRKSPLTDCAKLAVRTYRRKPREDEPPRRRCIICKMVYPVAQFDSSVSAACLGGGAFKEVVALPARVCSEHVGRLVRVRTTGTGGRNEWVSTKRELCVHCGQIKDWYPCNCNCDTCWTKVVWSYTRYWASEKQYGRYNFWRRNEASTYSSKDGLPGSLFVREPLYEDSATESFIDLPVHFRDNDTEIDQFPPPSRKLSAKL